MRNFLLVKEIPDGNGICNQIVEIAISDSPDKLRDHCIKCFNEEPLDGKVTGMSYFKWEGWYKIIPTKISII